MNTIHFFISWKFLINSAIPSCLKNKQHNLYIVAYYFSKCCLVSNTAIEISHVQSLFFHCYMYLIIKAINLKERSLLTTLQECYQYWISQSLRNEPTRFPQHWWQIPWPRAPGRATVGGQGLDEPGVHPACHKRRAPGSPVVKPCLNAL